jgi:SAM-dependent methyltransferase
MNDMLKRSGTVNGDLWGRRAADWATYQEAIIAELFDEVLARTGVREETQYLDLGCGAGLAAAKASAKGADVTGLDASEALLEIARSRLPGASFHLGELESLPFNSNQFDVVTSFNAVQYAANPVRALVEAARVTAPGGMVAVVTWGEPEGMEAAGIVAALKPLLPPPPPGAPGPFALSNTDTLLQFAKDGGLEADDVIDVECPWFYPDVETAIKGLSSTGVAAKAIMAVGQAAVDEAHANAIAPYKQANGSVRIGSTFRALLAHPS